MIGVSTSGKRGAVSTTELREESTVPSSPLLSTFQLPPTSHQVVLHGCPGQHEHVLAADAAHSLGDERLLVLHLVALVKDQVPFDEGRGVREEEEERGGE